MAGPAPSPNTPAPDNLDALSFEEALAELERIVKALEGGQQKLDARLRALCEAKLAAAEARVQQIVAGADGAPPLKPME